MDKEEFRKHYELEESHWWFAARREIIFSILKSHNLTHKEFYLLDAGCGTGFNLKFFRSQGKAFGCDLSEEALNFCQKRGLARLVRADAAALPFKNLSFDLVFFLDVLYHRNIKNDVFALQEAQRTMKRGGYLLLTDSAFNFLCSTHDIALQARERYRKKILRKKVEKANFSILKMSYFNFFLFFFVLTIRLWKKFFGGRRRSAESDLKPVAKKINNVLLNILKWEAFLLRHLNFPFGSSILCLAVKK